VTNCQIIGSMLAILAVAVCVACSSSSGRPAQDSAVVPPNQIVDFTVLYSQNCAGCHGVEGSGGAAMSLANPVYLAIADADIIRRGRST
jgi:mono/diheme cytochrome c family protein